MIFHRLIRKELRSVLKYYSEEVGPELSERFFKEFEELLAQIVQNPQRFHLFETFRRANFPVFPITSFIVKQKEKSGFWFFATTGEILFTELIVNEFESSSKTLDSRL